MINEANEVLSHVELQTRVCQILKRRGFNPVQELRLPNGKIADIAFIARYDHVHVIECKIDYRPIHLTEARYKYGDYCDYLWIAVPTNYKLPPGPNTPQMRFSSPDDTIGIFKADAEGMGNVRTAQHRRPRTDLVNPVRDLITTKLTDGERTPGEKTAAAAEPPKNSNGGHEGRRCRV